MRRALVAALLALLVSVAGCGSAAPAAPAASPTPVPSATVPAGALFASPWEWPEQGPPSAELAGVLEDLDTPEAISAFLKAGFDWRDDYDTRRFLSPEDLIRTAIINGMRGGVCTAFARFWLLALERQGIPAEFLAMWTDDGRAHAVAIFRYPARTGPWRLASNQHLEREVLAPAGASRHAAIVAAAEKYYPGRWVDVQAFTAAGLIWQRFRIETAAGAAPPLSLPPAPGQHPWTSRS